jgi:hypothetical protein
MNRLQFPGLITSKLHKSAHHPPVDHPCPNHPSADHPDFSIALCHFRRQSLRYFLREAERFYLLELIVEMASALD